MPRRLSILAVALICGGVSALSAAGAYAAEDGQTVYAQNCAACHQTSGKGIAGAFPALAGSKLANGPTAGPVDRVLNGHGGMPSFKASLSDEQVAAVLTYVRASFGNHVAKITPDFVAKARSGVQAKPDPVKMQAH